ncbi:bifunctional 1-(5-phosphoribosyl)-5-((5-phosphoribosylamino)methylideneamino)imidazole-4-carboxamide isomerase/phosphoribosylanthranilate isomerase PriA [Streptomyces griseocarneus]|nr:bifunctional 1-(5-phosphoribosyl)-5-((5-phosphoribosylamino)methylideneamino)imidazole-4-carboxamide isomerase/phosphoribosylanthranilate isomerase PriA [Streptomyces griseocarneus]
MPRVPQAQEAGAGVRFELFPSVHVAGGRVVHLVGDGQVPEPGRSDPVEAALSFQEQGATWLHLVMAEEEGGGFDLGQARRVIDAVSIDVQLMCRAGVDDEAALERVLATGCARFNLGRSALTDLRWCAAAIARHGERIGVSLPVHMTGRGPRLAGPGRGTDAGDLWQALTVLDDAGCARYVVTDVSREGSLSTPNLGLFGEVCDRTAAAVLAAGGIAALDDLHAVAALAPRGVDGALVGRALYSGAFTLSQALACVAGISRPAVTSPWTRPH